MKIKTIDLTMQSTTNEREVIIMTIGGVKVGLFEFENTDGNKLIDVFDFNSGCTISTNHASQASAIATATDKINEAGSDKIIELGKNHLEKLNLEYPLNK